MYYIYVIYTYNTILYMYVHIDLYIDLQYLCGREWQMLCTYVVVITLSLTLAFFLLY